MFPNVVQSSQDARSRRCVMPDYAGLEWCLSRETRSFDRRRSSPLLRPLLECSSALVTTVTMGGRVAAGKARAAAPPHTSLPDAVVRVFR
jgi:hypothetical protein